MTRFRRLGRTRYLFGVACVALSVVAVGLFSAGGASGAGSTSTILATFNTHGTYTWTVPTGITKISFDVFGASGGNVANGPTLIAAGGKGGEAKAHYTAKPGQTFEVVVGGRGGDGDTTLNGLGGFNGGGTGSSSGQSGAVNGAGGGGGSDVRIGGSGNPCVATAKCGYGDRIIAGGGGGGAGGGSNFLQPTSGGAGGALTGGDAAPGYGSGGTQEDGGWSQPFVTPGQDHGSFGEGADATPAVFGELIAGGGGGGGWYGGGGGCWGTGGGGGSGFISPFAKSGSFPGGTHGGDGLITIRTP